MCDEAAVTHRPAAIGGTECGEMVDEAACFASEQARQPTDDAVPVAVTERLVGPREGGPAATRLPSTIDSSATDLSDTILSPDAVANLLGPEHTGT